MIEVILGLSIITIAVVCFVMQVKIDKLQKDIYWLEAKISNATLKLNELERESIDN